VTYRLLRAVSRMSTRSQIFRPLLALAALAMVVVVASGCGTATQDSERGRTLFIQKCGTCHAMAQAGTTAQIGPDMDDAFAAARESGQDSDTVEGVVKAQVAFPRPSTDNPAVSMPADIVTGQDLDDVAAYVAEYAGVPGAAPPRVPGGPGAQVFANNGCGGCHTFAAASSGGVAGPNLDETLQGQSPAKVHEDIVDPDKVIAPGYAAGVMPPNFEETISAKELEDLVEFLVENTPGGSKAGGSKSKG
jgi:mono/diheme cytochrome c family protein